MFINPITEHKKIQFRSTWVTVKKEDYFILRVAQFNSHANLRCWHNLIHIMHDDVTLPDSSTGSTGVVVTFKSKVAASTASSGENRKSKGSRARSKVKQIARTATRRPSHITAHVCINANLNFPLRENTTPYWIRSGLQLQQYQVRAAKALFDVIMHKVY